MPSEASRLPPLACSQDSPVPDKDVSSVGQLTGSWTASDRVRHWVSTGCHVFLGDTEKPKAAHGVDSITLPSFGPEDDIPARESGGGTPSDSSSSAPEAVHLHGKDDDLLIPTSVEIRHVFHTARRTWQRLVDLAATTPPGSMPRGTCNPVIMLKDVPPIIEHKFEPSGCMEGVPVWRRRTGEDQELMGKDEDAETLVHGLEKGILLLCVRPQACRLTLDMGVPPETAPRGLAILSLCWSYIISRKLVELQNRTAKYSKRCLRPTVAAAYVPGPTEYVIRLPSYASVELVRWLCLVLAPGGGWRTGAFPVWAMFATGDVRFVILSDTVILFSLDESPPTASEAAELLIELCGLLGLTGSRDGECGKLGNDDVPSEVLQPYTAAFLAALALPTYGTHQLEPTLTLFLSSDSMDRALRLLGIDVVD